MKTVYILQNSHIEQALAWILPEIGWNISVVSNPDDAADLQIIDLDHHSTSKNNLTYDETTPMLALTFVDPEWAKFKNGQVLFNRQKVKFMRMPFLLKELKENINSDIADFDAAYRHPGVNLLSCMGTGKKYDKDICLKVIADQFQDLWGKSEKDTDTFLNKLPIKIITDFYSGLAHDRERAGFEGMLASLVAIANSFTGDTESWDRFNGTMGLISDQGVLILDNLKQRNGDYDVLLSLTAESMHHESVIRDLHYYHSEFQGKLESLLKAISTPERNSTYSLRVAVLSTNVVDSIRVLCSKRESLRMKWSV